MRLNLLHPRSDSISGLARCGNSITLPLPNLVAKLARTLLDVVRPLQHSFFFLSLFVCLFVFLCKPPLMLSACLIHPWHLLCTHRTYFHMFGDSLCQVFAACSLVILLLFVRTRVCLRVRIAVHVDFSPAVRWRS